MSTITYAYSTAHLKAAMSSVEGAIADVLATLSEAIDEAELAVEIAGSLGDRGTADKYLAVISHLEWVKTQAAQTTNLPPGAEPPF